MAQSWSFQSFLGDVYCRTRAKQEADAAAELQRDLARIEELTVEIRQVTFALTTNIDAHMSTNLASHACSVNIC